MIETLISSKTRIKLLFKFFLNSSNTSYLRGLESEFGESTNAIRLELNKLEKAGLLVSFLQGNKKFFKANHNYPLFGEITSILQKQLGFDKIIETVIERLGNVMKVYVTGALAKGLDSDIINLTIIGDIDEQYLVNLVSKAEKLIKRKIEIVVNDVDLNDAMIVNGEAYLLWEQEQH